MIRLPRTLLRFGACLVVGLVLSFLLYSVLALTAEASQDVPTPQKECKGLDIVYVIDQSGSMITNDRNKLRSNAVRTSIDILGDNAVYFCPQAQHRIAVIGFGDEPGKKAFAVYLPSTVISPTLEKLEDWNSARQLLKASIPITDDLGNTDPILGLTEASKILQTWQKTSLGNLPRKRAVVLVTDGQPCVQDLGCSNDKYTFDLPAYMRRLEALADPLGSDFPWRGADNSNSVYMYLIAFRDRTNFIDNPRVRQPWDRITQGHGGQVLVLQATSATGTNADLTSKVATVLDPLLGSRLNSWDCKEPIWVEPYVSDVTIMHIFRRGANEGVSLDDVVVRIKAVQGNTTIAEFNRGQVTDGRGQVNDYTRDGPNERYVFYYPEPGKYLVEVQGADVCRDIDVRIGQTGAEAELRDPQPDMVFSEVSDAPFYDVVSPTQFRFQLLQRGEGDTLVPLRENADYPLDVRVTVHSRADVAEPVTDEYTLIRMANEDAIYESRDRTTREPLYIRTPHAGHYTWELVATSRNPRIDDPVIPVNTPVVVLRKAGEFSVAPVEPLSFRVTSPAEGSVILTSDLKDNKVVPVPVQVNIQLVDSKGNALGPQNVLVNPESETFEVRLIDGADKLLETKRLAFSPAANVVGFVTTLRDLGAQDTADEPGQYKLAVSLLGNYVRGKYRPVDPEQVINFRRERAQKVSLLVTKPIEGDEIALIEGTAVAPVHVQVQVLDEKSHPLEATLPFAAQDQTPFVARLQNEHGQVVDSQVLQLDAANLWGADLHSADTDPLRYDSGCYQILVELSGAYNSYVFRPDATMTAPRQICMRLTEKFNWEITSPISTTHPLHPRLGLFPPVMPLPLVIEVENKAGQALDPSKVLKPGAEALFVGQLFEPGRSTPYDLVFRPGESRGQFVAEWPAKAQSEGQYRIQVGPVKDAYTASWMPATEVQTERQFTRYDQLLEKPWALAALIAMALLVALIIWFIFNLVTRPLGCISFYDAKSKFLLHDEVLGRPLRGWRLTYRSKHSAYAGMHLSGIAVTKAEPDREKGSHRAISLQLFDDAGQFLGENVLQSGDSWEFDADTRVSYE